MAGNRNRNIILDDKARAGIAKGIDIVAKTIGRTIGPRGKAIIIDNEQNPPSIVNDGAAIARKMYFDDPLLNIGALMIREAADKTAETGDGTSSTVVFSNSLIQNGLKLMAHGEDSVTLKEGMLEAVDFVSKSIQKRSKLISSLEDIRNIAYISGNNDKEIADLITNAFDCVGNDGHITFELSPESKSRVEIIDGMHIGIGWKSQYFMTDTEQARAVLENPKIFIINKMVDINFLFDCNLVKELAEKSIPFLVMFDQLSADTLVGLVQSKVKNGIKCVAVQLPGYGDRRKKLVEDIAVATGATVIDLENDISFKDITIDMLGSAREVIINQHDTTIKNPGGKISDIEARKELLKKQISDIQSKNPVGSTYEIAKIKERISILSCGLAVIYVGGKTKLESNERKLRVEDSLFAVRAALRNGIVAGGGSTFLRVQRELRANPPAIINKTGFDLVLSSLDIIARIVISNAGDSADVRIAKIMEMSEPYGYNAKTKVITNLLDEGVVDPTDVLLAVLNNAVSVASLLLNSDGVMVSLREYMPKLSDVPALQAAAERVLTGSD